MIIPVKCFTCGKVLADTYLYYIQEVTKENSKVNFFYQVEVTEINGDCRLVMRSLEA